jgi:phage shock protein E
MEQRLQSRGLSSDSFHSLLRAELSKANVRLLDVRGPAETALGSIENSTKIPHDELDSRLLNLPEALETPIVVYCASGRRAQAAAQFLETVGYQHVFNVISVNIVAAALAETEGKE